MLLAANLLAIIKKNDDVSGTEIFEILKTAGSTHPITTIHPEMLRCCINCSREGESPHDYFVRVGNNKYRLIKKNRFILTVQILSEGLPYILSYQPVRISPHPTSPTGSYQPSQKMQSPAKVHSVSFCVTTPIETAPTPRIITSHKSLARIHLGSPNHSHAALV
jgi:hypothetical protein